MPTLPVNPEPLDDARARLAAALETIFQAGRVDDSRPGAQPEQVFDVEEHGIRYIVSREAHPDTGQRVLHVSMSFFNADAASDFNGLPVTMLMSRIALHLAELFDGMPKVREVRTQANGIFHLICDDMTVEELQAPGDGPS